jgi:hypothetical protein
MGAAMTVLGVQVISGAGSGQVASRLREHDRPGLLAVTVADRPGLVALVIALPMAASMSGPPGGTPHFR